MDGFFTRSLSPLAIDLGVSESSVQRVLKVARALVSKGWCQRAAWCDANGCVVLGEMGLATHYSMVGAVRTAGNGDLVGEYALRFIRKVAGEYDLTVWNDNPVRTRAQVLELLDRALVASGGVAGRQGGWRVGVQA